MSERITVTDKGADMLEADQRARREERASMAFLVLHGILAGKWNLNHEEPSTAMLAAGAVEITDAVFAKLEES